MYARFYQNFTVLLFSGLHGRMWNFDRVILARNIRQFVGKQTNDLCFTSNFFAQQI